LNEFELETETLQPVKELPPSEKTDNWAAKWKAASVRWAKESNLTYLSNPAARRDFRVQFRGTRSIWLFTAFLLALGVAALFEYQQIAGSTGGVANNQSRLFTFYQLIIGILGVAISLIPPAMAAAAIVSEKQRRSLDLVFCTPIRPRVYLVGKVVSVFRYTWILLALSLPFTAMSVILGGASWGDVIGSYLMLSILGVVFTSIGLLFSSISEKAAPALVYTYTAVAAYLYVTAWLASVQNSFANLLNPFTLGRGLFEFTKILGLPIPNIALAVGTCLVIIKLCLSTAGAALVPPKPRERADLRLTVMGASAGAIGLFTYLFASHNNPGDNWFAQSVAMMTLPLAVFLPFLSCYGFDADQRSKPNGLFSWSKTLTGTPAGSVTYICSLILSCFAGGWIGALAAGGFVSWTAYLEYALYTAGMWSFFWALGRASSSFLLGLKAARVLQFLGFLAFAAAPLPILVYFSRNIGNNVMETFGALFYMLQPLFSSLAKSAVIPWTIFLWLATFIVARWSEKNMRVRLARKGADLGQIERAAGKFTAD
jgi:ABC-type transport system involved in multi-copper enzyme maturation permease subunit